MGKDAKKGKKENGGSESNDNKFQVNATPKWSVIDLEGITQPTVVVRTETQETAAASTAKTGAQGRRAKASTGPKMDATTPTSIGGDSFVQRTANPSWLKDRVRVYDDIKQRRQAELDTKRPVEITVTMPDGTVLTHTKDADHPTPFLAWKTTPYDVAVCISQGLADAATVARVTYATMADDYSPYEDGMEGEDMLADAMADGGVETSTSTTTTTFLWDLTRPLVGSVAKLEFLKFEDDVDAKTVFWHSSAHMMGEAMEHLYGCKLTIGPPLAGGFYYDSYMGQNDAFREEDCTFMLLILWLMVFIIYLDLFQNTHGFVLACILCA